LADRVEEMAKQQNVKKPKAAAKKKAKPAAKTATRGKKAASKKTAPKRASAKKAPGKKAAKPKLSKRTAKTAPMKKKSPGIMDQVLQSVNRAKNPVGAAEIADRTGLARKQVANALSKLKKQNRIKSKAKGMYEAA
jgi:hypothetical protein